MEPKMLESPNLSSHICLAFGKDPKLDGTTVARAHADWATHLADQEAREPGALASSFIRTLSSRTHCGPLNAPLILSEADNPNHLITSR